MKTVGIIGFNGFGEFLASKLDGLVDLHVSSRDPSVVPDKWRSTFEQAVECDYLILSIPLSAYEQVLRDVSSIIRSSTIIVDICSVKVRPTELLRLYVPHQKVVITHPLFGPQSAADSLEGHTVVLCPDESDYESCVVVKKFCESLGLDVKEMSAEEHDKEMANVHALTFFVARTLLQMGVHDSTLHTPSFRRILDLADLEKHHSEDLFRTIQLANPYAEATRKRFIETATYLDSSLSE